MLNLKLQIIFNPRKNCNSYLFFATALLFFVTNSAVGQNEKRPDFFGINPNVTVEPYYQKGELDLGILPLVYQKPISGNLDLRLTTVVNLGFRNSGNSISHLGLETALPIFFKKKESRSDFSKGFYAAPVVSLTQNRLEKHNNLGLWLEPGYHLLFDNKLAMSFGLQVGSTYFNYQNGARKWSNHFGIKVIIGRWFL
jgi:hypothetical protein